MNEQNEVLCTAPEAIINSEDYKSEVRPWREEDCGYIQYAKHEFEIIGNVPEDVQATVFSALRVISLEGHSGGSMGFFSGMFKHWSNNPTEPDSPESMLLPIWEIVKDLPEENIKTVLYYIFRTMTFKPLTPLTGADNEWNDLNYTSHMKKQNRRCGSVFMRADGTVYDSNAVVHCHPYTTFTGWGGVSGSFSSRDITFPFDVPDTPEYKYFQDNDCSIPVEGNEDAWLTLARDNFLRGLLPDGTIDERVWIGTKEECEETLSVFNEVKDLPFWSDKYDPDSLFGDAFYLCPRDERLIREGNLYVFSIKGYEKKVTQKTVMMLVRLMTDYKGTGFSYRVTTARKADKHFQNFIDVGYAIVNAKVSGTFFLTGYSCVTADIEPNELLYVMCKRKGLEYKGRKNARL